MTELIELTWINRIISVQSSFFASRIHDSAICESDRRSQIQIQYLKFTICIIYCVVYDFQVETLWHKTGFRGWVGIAMNKGGKKSWTL